MLVSGIDIVYVPRIEKLLNARGELFLRRVFHPDEVIAGLLYKHSILRVRYFAKRFAAKEALIKAVGKVIGLRDICVLNDDTGRPVLVQPAHLRSIIISLSDDIDYAIASAVGILYK